jgi:ribosomal protein L24
MTIKKGDKVKWKWGKGYAEGEVEKTYTDSTTHKIEGSEITRHGSKDNKALYMKQEDGGTVLKLESEVERI